MATEIAVESSAEQLAASVVARLVSTLARVQSSRTRAALALTAGGIMEQIWQALADSSAAGSLDWSRVDIFWGDERFVPAGSPDRNDEPAERILFSHPPFSAATRYTMPASDGDFGDDLDAAAAGYAEALYRVRRPDDPDDVPNFDVLLLGIGPDGHCCSLFPEHPGVYVEDAAVIPVRNSPKPPPRRLSLTFDGMNFANEIWVVASGAGKADAAAMALGGAGRVQVPSAGAQGRYRTLWLLDRAAAAKLPQNLYVPRIN
jgi:6-phosphogluconolactonase